MRVQFNRGGTTLKWRLLDRYLIPKICRENILQKLKINRVQQLNIIKFRAKHIFVEMFLEHNKKKKNHFIKLECRLFFFYFIQIT